MSAPKRIHIETLEDPIRPSQKYTLVSYLVPGYNCDEKSRPGILIRGSFPDTESAAAAAQAFELQLNTVVVETGRALPACPTVEEMQSCPQRYDETELNELVSGLNEKNLAAEKEFKQHCAATKEHEDTLEDLENYVQVAEQKKNDAIEYLALMKKQLNEYNSVRRRR